MGETAALASALMWALGSLVFAHVGARFPTLALNLLKTAMAWVGLALTLAVTTGRMWPAGLEGASLGWVALSGIIGLTLGDSLYFVSLVRLGPRRALILWALDRKSTRLNSSHYS